MRPAQQERLWAPGSFVLSLAVVLAACGTLVGNPEEDDGSKPPKPAGAVTPVAPVTFSLTDAPLDDARSVLLTVAGLEVSLAGEEWINVPLKVATEIDLLQYQDGASLPLAEITELPVGTYTQTRLRLSDSVPAKIVLTDGSEHELEIPSADKTGIKIVTPFAVEVGKPVALTIDFDLRKSVKRVGGGNLGNGKGQGNGHGQGLSKKADGEGGRYVMRPVLRLLRDDEAGGIKGDAKGKIVCVYPVDAETDDADDCDKSSNSGKVKNGRYKIAFLPPGDYVVRIFDEDGSVRDAKTVRVEKGKVTELSE